MIAIFILLFSVLSLLLCGSLHPRFLCRQLQLQLGPGGSVVRVTVPSGATGGSKLTLRVPV